MYHEDPEINNERQGWELHQQELNSKVMSKQKTPLAELIEIIEEKRKSCDPITSIIYALIKDDARSLLPKEREAIITAYNKGDDDTLNDVAEKTGNKLMMKFVKPDKTEAIKYFNETFEQ